MNEVIALVGLPVLATHTILAGLIRFPIPPVHPVLLALLPRIRGRGPSLNRSCPFFGAPLTDLLCAAHILAKVAAAVTALHIDPLNYPLLISVVIRLITLDILTSPPAELVGLASLGTLALAYANDHEPLAQQPDYAPDEPLSTAAQTPTVSPYRQAPWSLQEGRRSS